MKFLLLVYLLGNTLFGTCFKSTENIYINDTLTKGTNYIKIDKCEEFFDIENKISNVFIKKNNFINKNQLKNKKNIVIINFNNNIRIELNNSKLINKYKNSFKYKQNSKITKIIVDGEVK